jgi:hypothetical protein
VNYGKGPQASDLINPSRFADMGVDHTYDTQASFVGVVCVVLWVMCVCVFCRDFVEPRGQEEIRDLFASIGHSFDDATFDAIWRRVRRYCRQFLLRLLCWLCPAYRQAASAYDLNRNGEVSVEEFRMAMNEYEDTIAEGGYPEWAWSDGDLFPLAALAFCTKEWQNPSLDPSFGGWR